MPTLLNKKTKEQLIRLATDDIVALTDLAEIIDGSTLDGIIKALSARLADFYNDMEINLNAAYLSSTSGPYLDALGQDRGLIRHIFTSTIIPCTAETVRLRTTDGSTLYSVLGINPSVPYVILPKGHLITSSVQRDLIFTTDETLVILPNATFVNLGLTAQLTSGRIISPGVLDTMNYSGSNVFNSADLNKLAVVQLRPITGIEVIESDESYKLRITRHLENFATGNSSAVVDAIISHPEVADILITRGVRGTGSFDIVVFPTGNRISESVLNEFRSKLNSTQSFGEDGRVLAPDYVALSVALSTHASKIVDTIAALETFTENLKNKSVSFAILTSFLRQRGIEATIHRITVDYRDLLPSNTLTILPTEIFELRPRVEFEDAIEII